MASVNGRPAPTASGRESFLVVILLTLVGGAFGIFLILATGGFLAWLPVIACGMALFGYVHYWLWGRSFVETLRKEKEAAFNEDPVEEYESGHPPGERRF